MSKVVKVINNYTSRREKEKKTKQNENRAAKKRTLLFGSMLLVIVGILLIVAFNQKNQNQLLHEELVQAQVVLDERVDEAKDLEQQIKQLNDDNYITRIARSEFFLSEEGEIVFNLAESEEQEEKPEKNENEE
ncbi:septum formation initiator family protein [Salinicoccus sp. ID82-1]|uniref:Septum formation initiator family protein n=1 Tax=Salinicoccus cyprini TaxID=2493691 RepID=A0A558ARP4_9STAP|nr:septum formation initiator family protein [Salinicoccus cyprini]MCG1009500.1 septum formation initiator family protein [Salinicoccus sp. ID82-1]TVT26937.1 septum formation initiator family protein [Salinicoccus cyprini]